MSLLSSRGSREGGRAVPPRAEQVGLAKSRGGVPTGAPPTFDEVCGIWPATSLPRHAKNFFSLLSAQKGVAQRKTDNTQANFHTSSTHAPASNIYE